MPTTSVILVMLRCGLGVLGSELTCPGPPKVADAAHVQQAGRCALQGSMRQTIEHVSEEISKNVGEESEQSKPDEVPFEWATLQETPDPDLYKTTIQGKCLKLFDCPDAPITCDCPNAPTPCDGSTKNTYGVKKSGYKGKIVEGEHILTMEMPSVNVKNCKDFTGSHKCTKYAVAAGPYAITNEVEVKKGDVAKYSFKAKKTSDDYELFAGLYSDKNGLVDYQFHRGVSNDWTSFELTSPETAMYHAVFMLASYDRTGGCAVGSKMEIKDVVSTQASPTPAPAPAPAPDVPDGQVFIKKFDCDKSKTLAFQSTTSDIGETKIETLDISTGAYSLLFKLQTSLTTPPFRSINSCAINPKDDLLHCSMEINGKGSFLMRINDGQVGYVAKLPGWRYAATFDYEGTYYMYGNTGMSFISKVHEYPTWPSYENLVGPDVFSQPKFIQLGGDLAVLEKDLEGKGSTSKYLISVTGNSLEMARVFPPPYDSWILPTIGLPPEAVLWGTAWNFKSGIFFSADTGEGVYKLNVSSIDLSGEKPASFEKVGNAQPTDWNDGFSCMSTHGPF